jgi:hypothetical protein
MQDGRENRVKQWKINNFCLKFTCFRANPNYKKSSAPFFDKSAENAAPEFQPICETEDGSKMLVTMLIVDMLCYH